MDLHLSRLAPHTVQSEIRAMSVACDGARPRRHAVEPVADGTLGAFEDDGGGFRVADTLRETGPQRRRRVDARS